MEKELAEHYAATNIIPVRYRNIDALSFIYAGMTDARFDFTLTQVIDFYEQALHQEREERRREEERRRAAAEAAAWAAEEARRERKAAESYDSYSGDSSGESMIERAKRRAEEDRDRRDKRDAKRQAESAERERRRKEARDSQRAWEAVHKANMERRRKGQPELPYPPRKYY